MNCSSCGKNNPKGAAFCGQCGTKFEALASNKPPVTQTDTQPSPVANRRQPSITIAIVVAAVIVLGVLGFLVTRRNESRVATSGVGVTSSEHTALHYNLTDLTSLANMSTTNIYRLRAGINNQGQIIGISARGGLYRDGKVTDIGTYPGFVDTYPVAINDAGQVLCQGETEVPDFENTTRQSFVWQDGHITAIGVSQNIMSADGLVAINSKGQIIGNPLQDAMGVPGHEDGFIWDKGQKTSLGDLGGGVSTATSINNVGQVVGTSLNQMKDTHGFLWQDGKMSDLGAFDKGRCNSINDKGDIVGSAAADGQLFSHALLIHNGRFTNLEALGSGSAALSINNNGQIAGVSSTGGPSSLRHAVIWENGHIHDLNDCLTTKSFWTLTAATKINDRGQLLAEGTDKPDDNSKPSHLFLLTPQ